MLNDELRMIDRKLRSERVVVSDDSMMRVVHPNCRQHFLAFAAHMFCHDL